MISPPALELRGVSKSWGATRALDSVSLRFEAGRTHALIGRNGAGKSTLVKILAGALAPDAGEILVEGVPLRLRDPAGALARGIATVHQELSLVPQLSVAENILLGRLARRRGTPLLDHREIVARAAALLERLGIALDPRAEASTLSFAERQLVEIARAASREPRALLLDEPTSALSRAEADVLFRIMEALSARGVAIVHVTHRLDELARVAHSISALRDGRLVGTIPAGDATPQRLVDLMFGSEAAPGRNAPARGIEGSTVLEARGIASGPRLRDASFRLKTGEILGIAGLVGSGRSELLLALFGARALERGEIIVAGEPVGRPSPRRMIARGLALLPEDRKGQGLCLSLSVLDNGSLPSLRRMARGGLLLRSLQRRLVAPVLERLRLAAPGLDHPVSALSGGNQQKVVAGKWLIEPRRVLLLDEPTKGIDLHARAELLQSVRALADQGLAVILVSSELEELLENCDRILVLREGRITGEVDPRASDLPRLLAEVMGAAA